MAAPHKIPQWGGWYMRKGLLSQSFPISSALSTLDIYDKWHLWDSFCSVWKLALRIINGFTWLVSIHKGTDSVIKPVNQVPMSHNCQKEPNHYRSSVPEEWLSFCGSLCGVTDHSQAAQWTESPNCPWFLLTMHQWDESWPRSTIFGDLDWWRCPPSHVGELCDMSYEEGFLCQSLASISDSSFWSTSHLEQTDINVCALSGQSCLQWVLSSRIVATWLP